MRALETPPQTPLFRALNSDRYHRQALIREIQETTKRELLVYVAGGGAAIDHTDILGFADLLDGCQNSEADLLLQSGGGDIDRAEKIVFMCRSRCSSFRVIVPESAKSAATLIAIASDEIVMSDTSELGPIDPQILVPTPSGPMFRPAQSYLDGLETIKEEADKTGKLSVAYFPLLQHLDPALIDFCSKAIERSRSFATKWLEKYMCNGDKRQARKIAGQLLAVKKYLSHGAMIDQKEAASMGLKVNSMDPKSPLWQALWRLYCMYEVMVNKGEARKIYESAKVSLVLK